MSKEHTTLFASGIAGTKVESPAMQANINRIMDVMHQIGIGKIILEYYGGGDSGDAEGYTTTPYKVDLSKVKVLQNRVRSGYHFRSQQGFKPAFATAHSVHVYQVTNTDSDTVFLTMEDAIVDLLFASLEQYFAGWEINEGSFGQLILVNDDPEHEGCYVSLDHNQNYMETTAYKRTLYGNIDDAE